MHILHVERNTAIDAKRTCRSMNKTSSTQSMKGILSADNGVINHIEKLRNKGYQRRSFYLERRLHRIFRTSSNRESLSRAGFDDEEKGRGRLR